MDGVPLNIAESGYTRSRTHHDSSMRVLHRFAMVLAWAFSASCGQEAGSGRQGAGDQESARVLIENDGAVCLSPTNGAAIAVEVVFDRCLSSGCDRADAATCAVQLDNDRLIVTSELTISTSRKATGACEDDCARAKVACGSIEPTTASIRVAHGSDEEVEPHELPLAGLTQVFGLNSPDDCTRQTAYNF